MNIPENIKERISSLSLKTVRNGATPEEEQSANMMILKLKERYTVKVDTAPKSRVYMHQNRTVQAPYVQIQEYNWKKIAKDYLSPTNFKHFEYCGHMTKELIEKISWDYVAAEHLNYSNFLSYVDQTEDLWEGLKHAKDKLSATFEYRRKAYEIFKSF